MGRQPAGSRRGAARAAAGPASAGVEGEPQTIGASWWMMGLIRSKARHFCVLILSKALGGGEHLPAR